MEEHHKTHKINPRNVKRSTTCKFYLAYHLKENARACERARERERETQNCKPLGNGLDLQILENRRLSPTREDFTSIW